MPTKAKEAVMGLKNENKSTRDAGQTLGLQNKLSGLSLRRKNALVSSGQGGPPLPRTEESSKACPTDKKQFPGGRCVFVRDCCPQKTSPTEIQRLQMLTSS